LAEIRIATFELVPVVAGEAARVIGGGISWIQLDRGVEIVDGAVEVAFLI